MTIKTSSLHKLVSVSTVLLLCCYKKTQPRKLSSTHINTNSTYNNLTLVQSFLTWGAPQGVLESISSLGVHPQGLLKSISGGAGEGHICGGKR